MSTNKHLSLSERIQIQHLLEKRAYFKEIGRQLNKDCTTISKEVRNHLTFKNIGCFGNNFNNCLNRFNCTQRHICEVCTERNKQTSNLHVEF